MIISKEKKLELFAIKNKLQDFISEQNDDREIMLANMYYKEWISSLSLEERVFVENGDLDQFNEEPLFQEQIVANIYKKIKLSSCELAVEGKVYSYMLNDILRAECINGYDDSRKEFSLLSSYSNSQASKSIPHITHHIWFGHQQEDGTFNRPRRN